ncbi:MAG: carbamoyltransferase family protein [Myxococcota bacterium]
MVILGINHFYHDSSACLVVDGVLVAALEEERFTRDKHTWAFPEASARACLAIGGLEPGDVDYVAVSIKPTLHVKRKLAYAAGNLRGAKPFIAHELLRARHKVKELRAWYDGLWSDRGAGPEVVFVPHHLAHAAGTFFVSPYDSAAILSLDGSGEWATAFMGKGFGNRVERLGETYFPDSLGAFYEAATEFCGFRPNYDEGKTMGLAPFGDPERHRGTVEDIVRLGDDDRFHVDLSYFTYQHWGPRRCSEKFHRTFGSPRRQGEPFGEHHRDVAAAFQDVLESRVLELCRRLHASTRERHLVVSGGVALNSVMNGRIVRESPFEDIYVMPAAGDNGTSIGAAFWVQHAILGGRREFVHRDPYLGTAYTDEQIRSLLEASKLRYRRVEDPADEAAEMIHQGGIVGWFQDRMEVGPRALGHRSILADPTRPGMKDRLNAQVKHREAFRPFAPSTTVEDKDDYFDLSVEAPFMLKVCDVRPGKRAVIPAVTHVDGTARLQTVDPAVSPLYHRLIKAFGARSGVPVVLNTSFNVMGEPIVESPTQAVRCFYSTGLDALVIGSYVLEKQSRRSRPSASPAGAYERP